MFYVIIILLLAAGGYYFYNKWKKAKKEEKQAAEEVDQDIVIAVAGIKLTMKQALEQSWKFLYSLSDYVTAKFSPKDQTSVVQLGTKLIDLGVNYNHVVDTSNVGAQKVIRQTTPQNEASGQVRG
jgi:hypothetical protein